MNDRNIQKKAWACIGWTPVEDEVLLRLAWEAGPSVSWRKMAKSLPGRDASKCYAHWRFVLDPSIKKGPWSRDEDSMLAELHEKYGNSWSIIGEEIGRPSEECRRRCDSLDPSIDKRPWTPAEDRLLAKLHKRHGNSWVVISERIAGRSADQCRNHWTGRMSSLCGTQGISTPDEDTIQSQLHQADSPENARARLPWTSSENKALLRLVREAGWAVSWAAIAESMPGRDAAKCWHHCPSIKNGPWSLGEDRKLKQLRQVRYPLARDQRANRRPHFKAVPNELG